MIKTLILGCVTVSINFPPYSQFQVISKPISGNINIIDKTEINLPCNKLDVKLVNNNIGTIEISHTFTLTKIFVRPINKISIIYGLVCVTDLLTGIEMWWCKDWRVLWNNQLKTLWNN